PLDYIPILCSFVGKPPPPKPPPPAPAPRVTTRPAPAPPPPAEERLVLRGVNFAFNSDKLDSASTVVLDVAAEQLRAKPGARVAVEGYTDSGGSDAYNLKLSQRRAEAVMHYLVRKGVPADRLTARGFGKANPVATNSTAEGRALNRRVELKVR